MRSKVDIGNWSRSEHFAFFDKFEEPYFSVVVNVDVTRAYASAKAAGVTFFLYYLHSTLTAVNQIENFRYRTEDDGLYLYDSINVSPTVDREDGSFGFGFVPYHPDLREFVDRTTTAFAKIRAGKGLFGEQSERQDVIHFSALPWIDFTALTHARSFSWRDSVPKVSVGKMTECDGKRTMPVSVTVHHGLADGRHVGQFIELFQETLNR